MQLGEEPPPALPPSARLPLTWAPCLDKYSTEKARGKARCGMSVWCLVEQGPHHRHGCVRAPDHHHPPDIMHMPEITTTRLRGSGGA